LDANVGDGEFKRRAMQTTKPEAPATDSSDSTGVTSPPQISLPRGGGAIRGIGEKFGANPVTGTGSMEAPIALSPGRSRFGPKLALHYDSGAGNGPFGFGWSLSPPAITRKTDKGLPRYDDAGESDVFILFGAEDLVPVLEQVGGLWRRQSEVRAVGGVAFTVHRYRPRIEGLFARIERWSNPSDPSEVFWRSISRDDVTTWYGKTAESRIADPADASRIFSWLICETYDDKGDAALYRYKAEDGAGVDPVLAHESNRTPLSRSANRYLKRILYGNLTPRLPDEDLTRRDDWLFEAVFDYGEHYAEDAGGQPISVFLDDQHRPWPVRQDPFSTYRAGFEVRTYRLCRRVLMFHHFTAELGAADCLVRATEFVFAETPIASFVTQVVQSGYVRRTDGTYLKRSLPPLEFEYSQAVVDQEVRDVDPESLRNLPVGVDGARYQWLDLDGEGLQGVLSEEEDGWYYKRNVSPLSFTFDAGQPISIARFDADAEVATLPSVAEAATPRHRFLDLAGDGQLDCVVLERPTPGFFERTDAWDWDVFRPLPSLPNLDWSDPNLRFVDLTGDGLADIAITEDEVLRWYPSLGEDGFAAAVSTPKPYDEEAGPAVVFADADQSIFLADMSGDGLADIVRVRNGEICHWPNLGYGRFGLKVAMDDAPWFEAPELFDQRRIRLADIDGSGSSDIIYLGSAGVRLYFNQSGNRWSPAQALDYFPAVDDLAAVQAVDLLGAGTACLVWTSPLPGNAGRPMRYIDLMGGQKPHLLVKTANSLGAETLVQYAPSTKFYLADAAAGRPWITRLPFPVHVVERVETVDRISRNRFVSRYAYHHGYFDGVEREFRGFGMVEQWDTEAFAGLSADQQLPPATNLDASSNAPPALTRTWFHTGLADDFRRVSNFFAGLIGTQDTGEYYREPGLDDIEARRLLLEDTVLPPGLTAEEEREACRALKGAMLRQEVYGLDGSAKAAHPYLVTEQNFTLRLLQPRGDNSYAVFFTHAREQLGYHYERDPAGPRVAHSLTLEVDDYGDVLKSAAAVYPRRHADPTLDARDQQKQAEGHVTWSEADVTNPVDAPDAWRAPLPCESRSYELTGLELGAGDVRFSLDDVLGAGASAAAIAYEEAPTPGGLQKRLIGQARTLYRADDLSAALPLGQLQSLALPYESYKLALTPGLLAAVYGVRVTDAMVAGDGGHVHGGEGDLQWWAPSGRVFFSPDASDAAAAELASAQQHFFLPRRYQDPFGASAVTGYDPYDLLVQEARDPLGSVVTVGERDDAGNLIASGYDYRVLQPRLVTDANGNRAAASFDALGAVAGVAVMGKRAPAPRQGDLLDGFEPDLPDDVVAAHLADPLADPHAILGQATTRMVYDIFAYWRTREQPQPAPSVVYAISRETHDADLALGEQAKVQHSFSYSDGFGREMQKKVQAEPGPLVDGGSPVDPRWVGSGWTLFDNKGAPVRQFEPFFSATAAFESDVRVGVSPILFYDPLGRAVATLHPNHAWEKTVTGPWRSEAWDVNDTVLIDDPRTDPDVGDFFQRLPVEDWSPTWYAQRQGSEVSPAEQDAAAKAAAHAATPAVAHADTLGRTFLTLAHNRFARDGAIVDETYATRVEFDIQGRQRQVFDANDRVVMRYDYDLLGGQIHQASMEAGERWGLGDVTGKPIHAWDSRDHRTQITYDPLRRPLEVFLSTGGGAPQTVASTVYGENLVDGAAHNARGKPVQMFDQAGVVTNEDYDFKGNLLRDRRQLAADYKAVVDWSADPPLETETFASAATFDALNRPTSVTTPDTSVYRPSFNEAGLLESVAVDLRGASGPTAFVTNIDYDAKGQRRRIDYANGVATTYDHDPLTFRLTKLTTTRAADQATLQGLSYAYDPAGNITAISDAAQQTIYFNNQVVTADNAYVYDALYRLIRAEGREHMGQLGQPQTNWNDEARIHLPQPGDERAMGRYSEQYDYDPVGNFLRQIHKGPIPPQIYPQPNCDWTRSYAYEEPSLLEPEAGKVSNRLTRTTVGTNPAEPYTYDPHGNMTSMPHLTLMRWNFADQLAATARQAVNEGAPETTYYVYDTAGQRSRKVTERPDGTRKNERLYLGGYEVYREYDAGGAVTLERQTLHVMDDKQRVALVETRTEGDEAGLAAQAIRYQFGNHLGSASLELGGAGQTISYEEYYPYGSTSYQAGRTMAEVSLKRYRYTGMERDEESGLEYHAVRYYVSWLGRWLGPDPSGLVDGTDLYRYARACPTGYTDHSGKSPLPSPAAGETAVDIVKTAMERAVEKWGVGSLVPEGVAAVTAPVVTTTAAASAPAAVEVAAAGGLGAAGVSAFATAIAVYATASFFHGRVANAISTGNVYGVPDPGLGILSRARQWQYAPIASVAPISLNKPAPAPDPVPAPTPSPDDPAPKPKQTLNLDTGAIIASTQLDDVWLAVGINVILMGKEKVATQSVVNEFLYGDPSKGTVGNINSAGPMEKVAAALFLLGVKVIPDNPSSRVMGLSNVSKTDQKVFGRIDRIALGTGDQLGITTVTTDKKFVDRAANRGVKLDVIVVPRGKDRGGYKGI
jgi:RHS repeat-associated protein